MTVPISKLPAAPVVNGADIVPIVQSGQTRRTTVDGLRAGLARLDTTNSFSAMAQWSVTYNWNFAPIVLKRALSNASSAKQVAFLLDGDSSAATGAESWAIYLRHDAAIQSGTTSSANTNLEVIGPGRLMVNGLSLSATGIQPAADGTGGLGTASRRWGDVWAANGTIQTSDARDKRDVGTLPDALGLGFIEALKPVVFRFLDERRPAVTETRPVKRPRTVRVTVERETVANIDGLWRIVRETVEEDRPETETAVLHDAEGRPLVDAAGQPLTAEVPLFDEAEETIVLTPAVERVHRRLHAGLLAQDVKAALDAAGVDLGLFIEDTDTGRLGLRHDELLAPLIRAVQELAGRVRTLEAA